MPNENEDLMEDQESDLLGEEDFSSDDEQKADNRETKSDTSKKDEDWFIAGRYKTKKDADIGIRKTEQYIKQLEARMKSLEKNSKPIEEPEDTRKSDDPIDQAINELGIKDDDFITHPIDTNKKILRFVQQKMIPAGTQQVMNVAGSIRAELVKKEIKQMYPNFDIDGQEDKVANILSQRFNSDYIKKHPLKAISTVIEELGAKKSSSGRSSDGVPYSEDPTNESSQTKRVRSYADQVRDGITKANVGSTDLFS